MFKIIKNINGISYINEIKTIKQSTYYYCAPAVIKMCLNIKLSQNEVFTILSENTNDKKNWYADPDSVYNFLSQHNKYLRTSNLCNTSIEATEWIISSMIKNKVCAPMLVKGGRHWVLYSGYQENHLGEIKGIYIRDPWPTTESISFYPFSDYFFKEYFCPINVDGSMKGKVESYILEKTKKIINIEISDKLENVGYCNSYNNFGKNQIISEDLKKYGFSNFNFIKNGGISDHDWIILDKKNNPKFLSSYIEINNELNIVTIDINIKSVIGLMKVSKKYIDIFNKKTIKERLLDKYGIYINLDDINFVYEENISSSCFDPIINVIDVGKFNLSLMKI